MKSFKKLISFSNHKGKEKRDSVTFDVAEPSVVVAADDSTEMQELLQMRNRYEGLCAVSSLAASRAIDFSAAIQDLATYFVDTFGSSEDGDTSKVFKILGRVQIEISKILDLYGAHVTQTITEPTEILLTELRSIQESKRQHDEKRQLYENLRARIAKGRPKNGKGEAFSDQQLQVVKDEFDKLSSYVSTRLSSLEQTQSRSLISQAARHHAAQMHLFSRGHSSLQAVDPYMRQIVRERNIDRQLSGRINDILEPEDDSDAKSEDDVSYIDEHDDSSDLQSLEQSNRWDAQADSSGRSPNNQDENAEVPKNLSKEWTSLLSKLNRRNGETSDLKAVDFSGSTLGNTKPQHSSVSNQVNEDSGRFAKGGPAQQDTVQVTELGEEFKSANGTSLPSSPPLRAPPDLPSGATRGHDVGAFNFSSGEVGSLSVSTSGRRSVEWRPSSDAEQVTNIQNDSSGASPKLPSYNSVSSEAFHKKFVPTEKKHPGPKLPPSGIENPPKLSFLSPSLTSTPLGFTSNTKEALRQGRRFTQSGPLTFNSTPWSSQPAVGNLTPLKTQSVNSAEVHKSGPLGRSPLGRTFGSPRISPSLSPPRMSPPRISELHKLPPPPLNPVKTKSPRSAPIIAHSAPLSRHQDSLAASLMHATPLPPPPLGSVPRSLSLPSRSKQQRSKAPSIAQVPEVNEEEWPMPSHEPETTNTPTQANVQSAHKRVLSGNIPGHESGLPLSDLKFVHFNAARSASGTPTLSSLQIRPPSGKSGISDMPVVATLNPQRRITVG